MLNKVQLICYTDRLSGGSLKDLIALIRGPFNGLFGGVHILPFYYPIDGADAGFDPIDHSLVDPKLGDWEDIRTLSAELEVMADLIVNHMSDQSSQFIDFNEKGSSSEFHDLFLSFHSVFPNGATQDQLLNIYRPRPGLPFTYTQLNTGEKLLLWTTFTNQQIDINVGSSSGKQYLYSIIEKFRRSGINMIRLDAAGYAIKKANTSCFMIPESFDFIEDLSKKTKSEGIEVLVEIHSYYKTQIDIAKKVDWVYDFALPPLVLHAFFFKTAKYLKYWFEICPKNAVTVLDTHDGIGIVDIGPGMYKGKKDKGLVPDKDLDKLVEMIHINSKGESKRATGAAASNLDLYQVNCTYFDALGANGNNYLMARAIQFFAPGIPQVYYVGLMCTQNDMDLLEKTNVGRDINRHYFNAYEIEKQVSTALVKKLFKLIRFRNTHPSFKGKFEVEPSEDHVLKIKRSYTKNWSLLTIDFKKMDVNISYSVEDEHDYLDIRCN